ALRSFVDSGRPSRKSAGHGFARPSSVDRVRTLIGEAIPPERVACSRRIFANAREESDSRSAQACPDAARLVGGLRLVGTTGLGFRKTALRRGEAGAADTTGRSASPRRPEWE